MLTNLVIRNFKLFDEVEIELGDRVILIGPNNAGKTSALQALSLWDLGVKRWLEKRGSEPAPESRPGVTINRRDMVAVPLPSAKLLWRDLHVREGLKDNGKSQTRHVNIEILVSGIHQGKAWECGFEFDYANEESFYCRPLIDAKGQRMAVPAHLSDLLLAYLPPMSGLSPQELLLERGAINVRLGEGRTAEVLRNLCWLVAQESEKGKEKWSRIVARMQKFFGVTLEEPIYIKERGEIALRFSTRSGVSLDLSASGRGQQQTLLLLAHMAANPGAVLLLDEPDAHLEILRQRQVYQMITEQAVETGSQIIAASHSEVILNEAADRDMVIAFVGKPHRIDDRRSHLLKSLKEIGFDQYYQAEEVGWVLYLEGATDLAMLQALARRLDHPAKEWLERPFVHYVANQPKKAQEHFHALRYAKSDLVGIAIYDRLEQTPPSDSYLTQMVWKKREIENYFCQKATLLAYAADQGRKESGNLSTYDPGQGQMEQGNLFATAWRNAMEESIGEIEVALNTLKRPSPWGPDIKSSDEFLGILFDKFFEKLALPNLMRKTDYHTLVPFVPIEAIAPEISEKLDAIAQVAQRGKPAG